MKRYIIQVFGFLLLIGFWSCTKDVKLSDLVVKNKLYYKINNTQPFSGIVKGEYSNGKDSLIFSIDKGQINDLYKVLYETGSLKDSVVYLNGNIIQYKRFLPNGLIKKIPKNSLFKNKMGLTCFKDEKKNIVIFSGLAVSKFAGTKKGSFSVNDENFLNGRLNGVSTSYFPNSKPELIQTYKNNHLEGKSQRFFENGGIEEEGNYSNGNRTGKWVSYYQNKKIESEGEYINSRKQDEWKEYYQTGKLKSDEYYSCGVNNGKFIAYFENGNVNAKGVFINGKRDGVWLFYRQNGSLLLEQKYLRGEALSACACCGREYIQNQGFTSRPAYITYTPLWESIGGGAGGGKFCSKGCAARCR